VLIRRNAIVLFMCIELMLERRNLALVSFSRINGSLDGQDHRVLRDGRRRPPRSWSGLAIIYVDLPDAALGERRTTPTSSSTKGALEWNRQWSTPTPPGC
jgi:hypothetical protein